MPSKYPPRRPSTRSKVCRQCGRHEDEAGEMSARELCSDCGKANVSEAIDAMTTASGPLHDKWDAEWRRGMRSFVDSL